MKIFSITQCNYKGLDICIVNLEFESGCIFFIKIWNNQDFTCSPEFIKYTFSRGRVFSNKKKVNEKNTWALIYIYIYIYILKVTVVGKLQLINYEYTIQIMRNIVPLSRKYITS